MNPTPGSNGVDRFEEAAQLSVKVTKIQVGSDRGELKANHKYS